MSYAGPNSADVRINTRALNDNTRELQKFNKNCEKIFKVLEALNTNIVEVGREMREESKNAPET